MVLSWNPNDIEASGLLKVFFFWPKPKVKVEKLRPSKSKPKVKAKVGYFVIMYLVGIFRHRLLKGPNRNNVIHFF